MRGAVIVSRHPAAVEFIREQKPALARVRVLSEAAAADVRGQHVYGNVPLHLAAVAASVTAIEFSGAPPRGAEYTLADMHAAGARLVGYVVADLRDVALGDLDALLTSRLDGIAARLGGA